MSLTPYLQRVIEHHGTLTRVEASALLELILQGEATEIQLAALFAALATRGETPAEIAGFVDAMRSAATLIPLTAPERDTLVDACGTGGDHANTFNISTAAALVGAAAGATVAKHGNRAFTSRSGSADVLEALGIPVDLSPADAAEALRRSRFAFLHAAGLHPAMRAVMPVRRALGIRTVFNILGPLSNPAGAKAQVMGVYSAHLVPVVAEAMLLLGTRHAFVVHGLAEGGGLDEISVSGASVVAEVRDGAIHHHDAFSAEAFGLPYAPMEALRGGDAQTNAAILRAVFAGHHGSHRDVVLLNAAAILTAADLVASIPEGVDLAAGAIDSGAVTELVTALARTS